jgi:hypothetical protein
MNRKVRYLWIALAVVVVIAAPLGWSYHASQQVPPFYEEALSAEPAAERVASTEMFNSTMALVQSVRRAGRWEAEFAEAEINGWMAVDLKENHAELLDEKVSEPRVSLDAGRAVLAYRYESAAFSTVVSVSFDVYLAESNVIALRIVRVRAGKLPLPLKNVLDTIAEAATEAGWQIEWRQQAGDPVALVHVPEVRDEGDEGNGGDADKRLHLDEIVIRDGSIYLSGHTEVDASPPSGGQPAENDQPRVADQPGVNSTRQR